MMTQGTRRWRCSFPLPWSECASAQHPLSTSVHLCSCPSYTNTKIQAKPTASAWHGLENLSNHNKFNSFPRIRYPDLGPAVLFYWPAGFVRPSSGLVRLLLANSRQVSWSSRSVFSLTEPEGQFIIQVQFVISFFQEPAPSHPSNFVCCVVCPPAYSFDLPGRNFQPKIL